MLNDLVAIAGPCTPGSGGLFARPRTGLPMTTGLPTATGLPIATGLLAGVDVAVQGSGLPAYRMRRDTAVRPAPSVVAQAAAISVGVVSEHRTTDTFPTPLGVPPSRSPLS